MRLDLHTHSNHSPCSDQSVKEVLYTAKKAFIDIISITDHEFVSGVEEAISYEKMFNIKVIPGIEITSSITKDMSNIDLNSRVDILGYNIDWKHPLLSESYDALLPAKKKRANVIIEYLEGKGIHLTLEELPELSERNMINAMMTKGVIKNKKEAKALIRTPEIMTENPLIRFSTKETINLIIKLGGVPILAHAYRGPGFSAFSEVQVEELISVLLGYGLEGIEVFHPFHLQDHRIDNLLTVCEEQDLIPTIGSDHHSSQREYNGITDCQLRDSVLNAAQIDFSKILERLGILY